MWHQDIALPRVAALKAVVAIPVRDEAERITRCLDCLTAQKDPSGLMLDPTETGLVLLFNNCEDGSAALAHARLRGTATPFILAEVDLPPERANAGTARRMAMDIAANWMERCGQTDGVLLTTDADSRVPADWMARNLAALSACRGVAGRFLLDVEAHEALPAPMLERISLEQDYEDRLLRLAARLDPREHDPWPNHRVASGASYALAVEAYRAIGGLPETASGEDRALTRALEDRDIPVRHDPQIVVVTSGRMKGRASGGCADTLRARCAIPDIAGDAALEPVMLAARRFGWRGRLRRLHAVRGGGGSWCEALGLPAMAQDWMDEPFFGRLWARVEAASPHLAPHPLRPGDIPAQIRIADDLLSRRDTPSA